LREVRLLPGDKSGSLSPVLSCTTWGLPCHLSYPRRGGLLLHHFNLTCALLAQGHRRCIFCGTFHQESLAIFLSSLFTRHVTLRCPDFPQPGSRRTATVQETAGKRYDGSAKLASRIFAEAIEDDKARLNPMTALTLVMGFYELSPRDKRAMGKIRCLLVPRGRLIKAHDKHAPCAVVGLRSLTLFFVPRGRFMR
jgi:hypothetical protein